MEKQSKWERLSRVWLEDIGFLILFLILFITVFFLPIVISYVKDAVILVNLALLFLFFSGLFSGKGLRWQWVLHSLFWGYVGLKVARLMFEQPAFYAVELIVALVYTIFLVVLNIRLLFKDKEINFYRIIGAVNVYFLVSIYGALFFMLLSQFMPEVLIGDVELRQTDQDFALYMYYSLAAMTTVGFGELYAAEMIGKQLSVFLSAFGILYPAIIIAQLVGKKGK